MLLVLAGMDWPALNFNGINIRLSWMVLTLLVLMGYIRLRMERNSLIFVGLFLLSTVPSTFHSINIYQSIFYSVWIIFNFIFFYSTSSFYIKNSTEQFITALIYFSRLNIIICAFFYFIGFQIRPSAFFYEPSYLSIALIPYCCLIFVKQSYYRAKTIDYILIILYLILSQSGVFLVSLIAAMLFGIRITNIKYFIFFALLLAIYLFYSNNINSIYLSTLFSNIDDISLNGVFERGGNRWPRLLSTYDVGSDNMLYGVGLGNYSEYSLTMELDRTEFANPFLTGKGQPGVNIWLEMLATAGVLPFTIFVLFSCYVLVKIFKNKFNTKFNIAMYFIICGIMMIESSFLRGYLWCYIPLLLLSKPLNKKFCS